MVGGEISNDIVRGKIRIESEGTLDVAGKSSLDGNVTLGPWGDSVAFNINTTDDVMTRNPQTDVENGTVELDHPTQGVIQLPYYDK